MNTLDAINAFRNDMDLYAKGLYGITLDDWQSDVGKAIVRGDRQITIRSGHGVGKALGADEPVLTPWGWMPIRDVAVGDMLVSVDGQPTVVLGVFPQGVRDLFRVTLSDGSSVLADADHLWHTTTRSERKHGKPGEVRTTQEIAESLTFPNGKREGLNHQIPTCRPVAGPFKDLEIHPYVLGVLLGDGDSTGVVSSSNGEIFPLIEECGHWMGTHKPDKRSSCVQASVLGIRPGMRDLGLFGKRSHEKFIPATYRFAAYDQRLAVLQGLMDTDGTVGRKNNALTFSSVSPTLAEDVAELVRSLGGVVRRSERVGKCDGVEHRVSYRLYIALPPSVEPFRLQRKAALYTPADHPNRERTLRRFIASVEPEGRGEAVCVTVDHPSQLFVTRDHIVTHNTTLLALASLQFCSTGLGRKVAVTAPTSSQLHDALIPDTKSLIDSMPDGLRSMWNVKSDRIEFAPSPNKNFISYKTSRQEQPDALQGVHAPDGVLLIADEASGVPDAVFDAASGSMSGTNCQMILAGNPVRTSGLFFKSHTILKDYWTGFHVSCINSKRVDRAFIEEKKREYGEESNAYRVRVLGEFPMGDDDTVIPVELIDSAVNRDIESPGDTVVWGVDVARFGSDRSALCKRAGRIVTEPVRLFSGFDLMEITGFVKAEYDMTDPKDQPYEILVDAIGLGGGVADRLREMGLPARDVNVSELPAFKGGNYFRLRDELWFQMKAWLAGRNVRLPKDSVLTTELAMPRFKYSSTGKLKVESKDEMKRRGVRSPDAAESLMLTFASNAATARHGNKSFRQRIRRKIKGIV